MLPGASLKLFKIFGIQIEINISWFIILVLLTYTLSSFLFPQTLPGLDPTVYLIIGLLTAVLFFGSILFHELAHSLIAMRNNLPIKSITLFIFGGVSNMTEEPGNPAVELKVAVAGPLSSVFLGLIFFAIWRFGAFAGLPLIAEPALYLMSINMILAVFNMIPGFPLDGGRVFRAILWRYTGSLVRSTEIASRAGQITAFALAFLGLLLIVGGALNGLWFILIAWFLEQAAVSGAQGARIQATLSDISVREAMSGHPETVPPGISVTELVDDHFSHFRHGRFPVMEGEQVIGIVTLDELRRVQRPLWAETTVRQIMKPVEAGMKITPEENAFSAMRKMAEGDLAQLLVFSDGELMGILTRGDIMRLIRMRESLNSE